VNVARSIGRMIKNTNEFLKENFKTQLGRHTHGWENNITANLKKMEPGLCFSSTE
jgi:hypothetical protein